MFRAAKRRKKAPSNDACNNQSPSSGEEGSTRVVKAKQHARQHPSSWHVSGVKQRSLSKDVTSTDGTDLGGAPSLLQSRFVGGKDDITANHEHIMSRTDTTPDSQREIQKDTTYQEDHVRMTLILEDDDSEVKRNHPGVKQISQYQLAEVIVPTTSIFKSPVHTQRPKKPRLGRDGKPFRPRLRERRRSEDIARDAAVEAALHAQGPSNLQRTAGPIVETAVRTDDQILAEMKTRFADADSRRSGKTTTAVGVNARQGPKLGGSKNARAKTS